MRSVNNSELEVLPLIQPILLLNDTFQVSEIYDSCSKNQSLINAKFLKIKKRQDTSHIQSVNLKAINGEKKTKGIITIKIKIENIERIMDIFVIDNENFYYDFLIGLDCIKNFNLMPTEKLNIIKCRNPEKKRNF